MSGTDPHPSVGAPQTNGHAPAGAVDRVPPATAAHHPGRSPVSRPPAGLGAADVLADVAQRLEQLDRNAGLGAARRSTHERLVHLARLLLVVRTCARGGLPFYNVLVAIAAQAIQWATAIGHEPAPRP